MPSGRRTLNSWASVASLKAVAVPRIATSHIHSTAPGPPRMSASATPTMFPVPTRQASPTAKAWKEVMPPWLPSREPITEAAIASVCRTWTPRVLTVKKMPAPMRSHMRPQE